MRVDRYTPAVLAAALTLAAIGEPARADAANGGIGGTVVDATTGEPLAGVAVVARPLTGTDEPSTITDEHGAYRLDLPPGTYAVTFFYDVFQVDRSGVVVTAGQTAVVTIALEPAPAPDDDRSFALVANATWLGDRERSAAASVGGGVEVLLLAFEHERHSDIGLEGHDHWLAEAGGVAAVGRDHPRHRDVIDVHLRGGVAWYVRRWVQPYAAGGVDLLQITSYEGASVGRGTTLGLSVVAGALGRFGPNLEYMVTGGWTDAIVPGSGAELDAFAVQVGVGVRLRGKALW